MESTLIGTTIGIISAFAAIWAATVSRRSAKESQASAASQQRLGSHMAASDWLCDLRGWASDTIEVLAEASYRCGHADPSSVDCADQLRACQHRLSALIDSGRFYLPNQRVNEHGLHKPSAYRGFRHAALDPLIAAERVISGKVGSGTFSSRELALIEMRREFVSAIQRILAPDLHNQEIARMITVANQHRAADKTLGGLLPDDGAPPAGADILLNAPRGRSTRRHTE